MADGHLPLSREAVRGRLSRRALIDPGFRRRLNDDPRAAAAELSIDLPAELRVVVLDEGDNQLIVVVAAPETRVDGLHPLVLSLDPEVERVAAEHLQSPHARLKVGSDHITDSAQPSSTA